MDEFKDYESEKENESGTSKIKNIFKNKRKPNLTVKFSVVSSHSTVGFPLESRISLAYKFVIFIFHTFLIRKL